jgi:hypothetical protein
LAIDDVLVWIDMKKPRPPGRGAGSNALLVLVAAFVALVLLAALTGLLVLLPALAGLLVLLAGLLLLAALLTALLSGLLVLLAALVRILRAHEVSLCLHPLTATGDALQRSGRATLSAGFIFRCLLTCANTRSVGVTIRFASVSSVLRPIRA